ACIDALPEGVDARLELLLPEFVLLALATGLLGVVAPDVDLVPCVLDGALTAIDTSHLALAFVAVALAFGMLRAALPRSLLVLGFGGGAQAEEEDGEGGNEVAHPHWGPSELGVANPRRRFEDNHHSASREVGDGSVSQPLRHKRLRQPQPPRGL